ncbi:MAG: polyprenyl synthetase family protein [Candidatus Bathyarchaeota archaeon]|nr:polyprenyl synthetase family protein [Candidatus Bathyarchaeota archaeon]
MTKQDLTLQIQTLLTKYGQKGLQTTKQNLKDKNIAQPIQKILTYFIEETWPNTHHPALIALSCEAAGGNPEAASTIGAAVVMLTGAADIHDDIIDNSKIKSGKQTIYGKYNKELVLLAGDVLFLKGYFLLQEACKGFPAAKQQAINSTIEQAFNKIAAAITSERVLREKPVNPDMFHKVLEQKGTITQACVEVGAILADAPEEQRMVLCRFGKTLGYLMTLKNEFDDLYKCAEIRNRSKNEILPLPLLYALKDNAAKKQLTPLLQGKISQKKTRQIAEITENVQRVIQLKTDMFYLKNNEQIKLSQLPNTDALKLLLDYTVVEA